MSAGDWWHPRERNIFSRSTNETTNTYLYHIEPALRIQRILIQLSTFNILILEHEIQITTDDTHIQLKRDIQTKTEREHQIHHLSEYASCIEKKKKYRQRNGKKNWNWTMLHVFYKRNQRIFYWKGESWLKFKRPVTKSKKVLASFRHLLLTGTMAMAQNILSVYISYVRHDCCDATQVTWMWMEANKRNVRQ